MYIYMYMHIPTEYIYIYTYIYMYILYLPVRVYISVYIYTYVYIDGDLITQQSRRLVLVRFNLQHRSCRQGRTAAACNSQSSAVLQRDWEACKPRHGHVLVGAVIVRKLHG